MSRRGRRLRRRAVGLAVLGATVMVPTLMPGSVGAQTAGGDTHTEPVIVETSPELEVVGSNTLNNEGRSGDVAVVGDTAIVAGGYVPGGGLRTFFYNPVSCPSTNIEVVDISDPSSPTIRSKIKVPAGVSAEEVDAIEVDTPTFTGKLAAVALVRCDFTGNLEDRGVAYYDLNLPDKPKFLGRYQADSELFTSNRPCKRSNGQSCSSSQDSVSLQQTDDGRVLSISTEPFASASGFQSGDLRIVDVTDPTNPVQIGDFDAPVSPTSPRQPLGGFSNNGCRPFTGIYTAALYDNGLKALAGDFDDGLLDLNITPPPPPPPGPPSFSTASAANLAGKVNPYGDDRKTEGNGVYVAIAGENEDLGLLSDEDWIAPNTSLDIDSIGKKDIDEGSGLTTGNYFGCEAMFTLFDPEDTAQIYRHKGEQVPAGADNTAEFAYIGLACPGTGAGGSPFPIDARTGLPVDPSGKIAVVDRFRDLSRQGTQTFPVGSTFCSAAQRVRVAQNAGAIGVVLQGSQFGRAFSFDGDPTGLEIPAMTTEEDIYTRLRATLCPSTDPAGSGNCGRGNRVTGSLQDREGAWGGLHVADLINYTEAGFYTTPGSKVFPPPDLGVYSANRATSEGDRAYVAWNSDGLRVLDLSNPSIPVELGHFVPPDTPDPTGEIPAKAYVQGVAVAGCNIVVTDINSGLYVVEDPGLCPAPG